MIVNKAWVYKEIRAVSEANERKEEKLQADIKAVSYKQKSHIWKTGKKVKDAQIHATTHECTRDTGALTHRNAAQIIKWHNSSLFFFKKQ